MARINIRHTTSHSDDTHDEDPDTRSWTGGAACVGAGEGAGTCVAIMNPITAAVPTAYQGYSDSSKLADIPYNP